MDLRRLDDYACENHGLVTRTAAARLGISSTNWYRLQARGVLEPLHPNVARMFGTDTTPEQVIAAAVLAAGPGALASHRSAARLWGIARPDGDAVDVTLVERSRRAGVRGAAVHRPRDHLDLSPVRRLGIPTTNVLRTLRDLGAVDPAAVPGAVGHVVTTGLASPVALRRAIIRHARRGRRGVPALRSALDEWVIDGKPVDSVLEPAMRRLLARSGLPEARFHVVIGPYEVDFWIPGTPVVLECDGWEHHGRNRARFEADKVRDAELAAQGYVVVRFTYRQLVNQPARTAERIGRVLARWAPDTDLGARGRGPSGAELGAILGSR